MRSLNKLYTNSFYTMVGKCFTILGNFLIVPFIIKTLGIKGLGQWELILSVLTLIVLFQATLGFTLIWKFSSHNDSEDNSLSRWIGIGSFLSLLLIIVFVLVFAGFRSEFISGVDPRLFKGLLIVLTVTLLSSFIEVGAALLNSKHLSGYVALINGITFLFTTLLSIYFLKYTTADINILIFCYSTQKILYAGFIVFKLYGSTSFKSFVPKIPNKNEWKIMGPYILSVLLGAVLVASRDQFIKFLVAKYSTIDMVGNYAIIIKLTQILFLMPSFFVLPGIASIAEHNIKGETEIIDNTFVNLSDLINAVVILFSFVLLFYFKEILYAWTGINKNFDYNLSYIIITLVSYIIILTASLSILIKGVGKVIIETYYIIFNLLISLVIVVLTNYFFGINYAIISSFISWVISGVYFLIKAKANTNVSFRSTWRSLFLITVCIAIVYLKNILFIKIGSFTYCVVTAVIIIPFFVLMLYVLKFFPELFLRIKVKLFKNELQ